jgi:undecaprenyl-diphosphatase
VIEWFRRTANQVHEADVSVSRHIAELKPRGSDLAMLRLTRSANHSALWFVVAGVLASRPGTTRKAALRAILAITGASATANGILKPLFPRRRPPADEVPNCRQLWKRPGSSSFPSGHAASAAAFATAVALENPRAGAAVAPLAAAVAYSRVHVGVHWTSDVVAGAAVGMCSALLTQRWWPVRPSDEAAARPLGRAPELPGGAGLVIVINPRSGDPGVDPTESIHTAFPSAELIVLGDDIDLEKELERRLDDSEVLALGVAGGDGTVSAVVEFAARYSLPLVLIPAGTLNHFARDVGVYDLTEAVDASSAGEAVAVDIGQVTSLHDGTEITRAFLNTASLGSYSELVRLRERWEGRMGKWPAFLLALIITLHRSNPTRVLLNGEWHPVWILFVGNGPYHPDGMVPAWRPRLDSGLLDVRWLRAAPRLSRTRAFIALALAALHHSRVYQHMDVSELDVELDRPSPLALDGEVVEEATRFSFRVKAQAIPVYRRDEDNPRWADRYRPYHRS